jgi:hypothetical protein
LDSAAQFLPFTGEKRPMQKLVLLCLSIVLLSTACAPVDPQAELTKAAQQLSGDLPKQIDANTVLVAVEAGEMEVTYTYEVMGISDDQLRRSRIFIKQAAKDAMIENKSKLRFYAQNKIPMNYIYRNQQGDELISYTLHPWE